MRQEEYFLDQGLILDLREFGEDLKVSISSSISSLPSSLVC